MLLFGSKSNILRLFSHGAEKSAAAVIELIVKFDELQTSVMDISRKQSETEIEHMKRDKDYYADDVAHYRNTEEQRAESGEGESYCRRRERETEKTCPHV